MSLRIEFKSWRPELDASVSANLGLFYRQYFYFARRRVFNRHTLWLSLAAAGVLAGIFSRVHRREAWVFVLAFGFFSVYLYLRALKLATSIRLHWITDGHRTATERDTVEVRFEVDNGSAFPAGELRVEDQFRASTRTDVRYRIADDLPAFGRVRGSYKRTLDAGMGEFELGPFRLVVGDPLGIFEFVLTEGGPRTLRVLPRAEPIDGIPIAGSRESFQFGLHELPAHGASVNFLGVREYARGDSMRQIAWRLSARSSRLLVKDFEKAVNAEVTIFLNMCAREHMGRKASSTWEYAKDAALSVIRQQISEGGSVQLLSNGVVIPFGQGAEHVELVTARIFRAMPTHDAPVESSRLLENFSPLIPSSSTLIYISPFFARDMDDVISRLITLGSRNIEVICLAIDAPSFMHGASREQINGLARPYVEAELARASTVFGSESSRLAAAGIRVYSIQNGRTIGNSLLRPASFAMSQTQSSKSGQAGPPA